MSIDRATVAAIVAERCAERLAADDRRPVTTGTAKSSATSSTIIGPLVLFVVFIGFWYVHALLGHCGTSSTSRRFLLPAPHTVVRRRRSSTRSPADAASTGL